MTVWWKTGLVRIVAFAAAMLMAVGVGASTAQAAPSAPAGDVSVAAECTYVVVVASTAVRSGPGTQYPVVRTKTRGQHLTGPAPCLPTTNNWYIVYLSTGQLGAVWRPDVRISG